MSKPEGFDLSGLEEAMARLEGLYDSARAQREVADAAREAAGVLNAPSWWKESVARFHQAEGHPPEDTPPS